MGGCLSRLSPASALPGVGPRCASRCLYVLRHCQTEGMERITQEVPVGSLAVERRGDVWLVRGDQVAIGQARGLKALGAWALAEAYCAKGLVTAGNRDSPQVAVVAWVAQHLKVPCAVFVGVYKATPMVMEARAAGAQVTLVRPPYTTVVQAQARECAREHEWLLVPFGMADPVVVQALAGFEWAVPTSARRLVVPVGSGIALAAVLHRVPSLPVLGVVVGKNPVPVLDRYAPSNWRERTTLIPAMYTYHQTVRASIEGVPLDPFYEAKCGVYLRPDDVLFVVGYRARGQRGTET